MTTGEQLSLSSSVSNVSALEHLSNLTGTGVASFVPFHELECDIRTGILDADLLENKIEADLIHNNIDASIDSNQLDANIIIQYLNIETTR